MTKQQRQQMKEQALKDFIHTYYCNVDTILDKYKDEVRKENDNLSKDFEECWNQLTPKEQEYFAINLCYDKNKGKCEVYFHVLNLKGYYYEDLSLEEFRKRNKNTIQVYDCR